MGESETPRTEFDADAIDAVAERRLRPETEGMCGGGFSPVCPDVKLLSVCVLAGVLVNRSE
jgi:hypothetical protein